MTQFLRLFADRLGDARWRPLCRIEGRGWLDEAIASGRPVVLVTLHYGSLTGLSYLLRARGMPLAFLTAGPGPTRGCLFDLNALADAANGLAGVPLRFPIDRLWEAWDFLGSPGRMLGVAIEGDPHHRNIAARGPGYSLLLAPGAFRLAAIADAAVIPCLISSTGGFGTLIRFGPPVPPDSLRGRRGDRLACEHVARVLGPWIAECPGQIAPRLLSAIVPEPSPPAGMGPVARRGIRAVGRLIPDS